MNNKLSIWNLIRSIIAVVFAFYVTKGPTDLYPLIIFLTIAVITKFFLELCIDVKEILKELQKRNKPD